MRALSDDDAGVTFDAPGAQAVGNTAIAASAMSSFGDNEIMGSFQRALDGWRRANVRSHGGLLSVKATSVKEP
jgi:hypothetical protein